MNLSVDLSKKEIERLQAAARRLNVPVEKLAKAALCDLLNSEPDFEIASDLVLKKNRNLYRRLS